MDSQEIKKIISESKSKNEVLSKIFGYSNQKKYEKLNEWIKNYEIDISHFSQTLNYCLHCGKEITKNGKKFCCKSCSATFNNKKRRLSENTKEKISKSLSGRFKDCFGNLIEEYNGEYKGREKECVICGKTFFVKRKNGRYSCATTCSEECSSKLRSQKNKISAQKLIESGRHKGWQSRNIISYPEKFFIKVLEQNQIQFEHNFPILKKGLGLNESYNYFLDFYLKDKNIDLEIDGRQHNRRIESDNKRDEALTKNGFYVYRIKWRSINSDEGKKYIKEEIDKFLNFYRTYKV